MAFTGMEQWKLVKMFLEDGYITIIPAVITEFN